MDRLKNKWRNLSLVRSMVAMTAVVLFVVVVLSIITINVTTSIRNDILESRALIFRVDKDGSYQLKNNQFTITMSPKDANWEQLDSGDQFIYNLCNVLMILLPVLFVVAGILMIALWFYRAKLRKPLAQMGAAIEHISKNDLDFTMQVESSDELGKLCHAMECMRQELVEDQEKLWRIAEEQRVLNASIAHDLRTPLTVLKGYLDYFEGEANREKISPEVLEETFHYMSLSVQRMEKYVAGIREVQKLEEVKIHTAEVSVPQFEEEWRSNCNKMNQRNLQIDINNTFSQNVVEFDSTVLFRIIENLVSNAMRYAIHGIKLSIQDGPNGELQICVLDDGPGFPEEVLQGVGHPYYTTKQQKECYGLGLWISQTLCNRMGANLVITNDVDGGASATITLSDKV